MPLVYHTQSLAWVEVPLFLTQILSLVEVPLLYHTQSLSWVMVSLLYLTQNLFMFRAEGPLLNITHILSCLEVPLLYLTQTLSWVEVSLLYLTQSLSWAEVSLFLHSDLVLGGDATSLPY